MYDIINKITSFRVLYLTLRENKKNFCYVNISNGLCIAFFDTHPQREIDFFTPPPERFSGFGKMFCLFRTDYGLRFRVSWRSCVCVRAWPLPHTCMHWVFVMLWCRVHVMITCVCALLCTIWYDTYVI